MIHAQNTKSYVMLKNQSVGTSATVSGTVDTLGYDYAVIEFNFDTAATTASVTTQKLSEGDTTSAYTDITAFVGGGVGGFTIPAPAGTSVTAEVQKLYVNLKGRKRYLKATLGVDAARICSIKAELSRAEEAPDTAAKRGLTLQVIG
jgi:hypothetical protein